VIAASYAMYWPRVVASLIFGLSVLFLLFRVRPSPMVRSFAITYGCAALFFACTFGGGVVNPVSPLVLQLGALGVGLPMALRSTLLFPIGQVRQGMLARFGPWIFSLMAPLDASRFYGWPLPARIGAEAGSALLIVYLVACVAILARTYRASDPIARRRIKWFLLGVYWAVLPPIAAAVLTAFAPRYAPALAISAVSLALIPIFLIVSITRYELLDVDRVLSATASYTLLLVAVLAIMLVGIPRFAPQLARAIDVDSVIVEMGLAVALAGLAVPMNRILHERVDRVLFIERYALEHGVAELVHDLSSCTTPEDLTRTGGDRLVRLLRPESCLIYMRNADAFGAAFAHGEVTPATFERSGPLVAALAQHRAPLAGHELARGPFAAPLAPFEQAALETLGVPIVMPVRRAEELVAFVCLGPKQSGDQYTATDRTLLSVLAEKLSTELQRFDQEQMLAASRRMQETLRRYVPGTLADHLDQGGSLDVGECEVSVLFVDLRGYSRYAAGVSPEETFSTVSRYTETVSAVVRRHGGTVVEFNGDGMMAVFGAPEPLAAKERAAEAAGEEIVGAVEGLAIDGRAPGDAALSVGVGIATGPAFVGSIRAVDRLIWTAIGDTTNRAARLQTLTRELGAAMVIDAATWRAAGERARAYEMRASVSLRGRPEPEDLYVLPLLASA
jgi:class 3 adenylate cyclase